MNRTLVYNNVTYDNFTQKQLFQMFVTTNVTKSYKE